MDLKHDLEGTRVPWCCPEPGCSQTPASVSPNRQKTKGHHWGCFPPPLNYSHFGSFFTGEQAELQRAGHRPRVTPAPAQGRELSSELLWFSCSVSPALSRVQNWHSPSPGIRSTALPPQPWGDFPFLIGFITLKLSNYSEIHLPFSTTGAILQQLFISLCYYSLHLYF